MPASTPITTDITSNFTIPVIAAIVLDKIELNKIDAWALATRLSNPGNRGLIDALSWSMPLLGTSQLMIRGYAMGDPNSYGVIVGDGQIVSSLNPLITEWLFGLHTIPSGSCLWVNLAAGTIPTRGWEMDEKHSLKVASPVIRGKIALIGPIATLLAIALLAGLTSISYFSVLFLGILYMASIWSNLVLAGKCDNTWAGFVNDKENVKMLVIAAGDSWAVLSGPRNLVKTITTGSHITQKSPLWEDLGQYILVFVLLSAGLLQGATRLDGMLIGVVLLVFAAISNMRAKQSIKHPVIRGVSIREAWQKPYARRADLVNELSQHGSSDAWAYDARLLTRRYVPADTPKTAQDD
jgi:hypothetical protein